MIQLGLTENETLMLKAVLESYLSDLRMEIADTDRKDFRDILKDRELFLKELIKRLTETREIQVIKKRL